ncbi:MAG: helix-turn-helix domain-containing protein [Hyphomicrobiaceae bacterium]
MVTRNRQETDTPPARLDFARRLRELRVPRGFRTARSLARTLDIDENRYTRYERAEVEPDLDMIRRICEALAVTPNDLLGSGGSEATAEGSGKGALASNAVGGWRPGGTVVNSGGGYPGTPLGVATAAWQLAEAATDFRFRRPGSNGAGAPSPLSKLGHVGRLYRDLMQRPFETITELSADPALADTADGGTAAIEQHMVRLLDLLKTHATSA